MAFKIRLEGWRFLPHSYSLVFGAHAAELVRRADLVGLELSMVGLGGHESMRWNGEEALPLPEDEALVNSIPWEVPGGRPDAIYRVALPFDFNDAGAGRTLVHVSCDSQAIPDGMMADYQAFAPWIQRSLAHIATPSAWSRDGLIRAGAPADRVHIVPHGVDARLFMPPTPEERQAHRMALRIPPGGSFVFLSIGTLARRKGTDILLAAFKAVHKAHPEAVLVLKGSDGLFRSRSRFEALMREATAGEDRPAWPYNVVYSGATVSSYQIAQLYKAADCYVTPYRAEAFNLPALQAVASGIPLIATGGGPTDDFMPHTGRRIASTVIDDIETAGGRCLEPDLGSLVEHMIAAIENPAGSYPELGGAWSWASATDKLLEVLQA